MSGEATYWFNMARIAYEGYGDEVEWKNHLGLPMPQWDDLPRKIQAGWVAAARACCGY